MLEALKGEESQSKLGQTLHTYRPIKGPPGKGVVSCQEEALYPRQCQC